MLALCSYLCIHVCVCVCVCVCVRLLDFLFECFQNHSDVVIVYRSCTLLTCTTKGNASIRSIDFTDSSAESSCLGSSKTWDVCASGNILCCKVDGNEKFALFGG